MCEIALVVHGTNNSDNFDKDCMCYKAGDIIEVMPDGWNWGTQELLNPNWRIIKFPGVDRSQMIQFTSQQLPVDPLNPSPTLLRRALRFAWQNLPNTTWAANHPAQVTALQNYIADDTRAKATLTVPANTVVTFMAELNKLTVVKDTVTEPTVIG
jgi:hypothetical protein